MEHHYYDIGVAVGTERGLVVPVLRDCDQMSFAEIEQGIVGFAEKARSQEELPLKTCRRMFHHHQWRNLWIFALHAYHQPPQSGILDAYDSRRPVVRNGESVARPMMYLALLRSPSG